MTIDPAQITGLVLAGGDSRMGGVDRGLQTYGGMPLALHATLRLGPQVGQVMIHANHNLAAYESMGVPVWPDAVADYDGPLAAWLTGLEHCATPYMATAPCDAPNFPVDLVERLAHGLAGARAQIAMAATRGSGGTRVQPAFCLIDSSLLESLAQFLQAGHRQVGDWTRRHRCVEVVFDDASGFLGVV